MKEQNSWDGLLWLRGRAGRRVGMECVCEQRGQARNAAVSEGAEAPARRFLSWEGE